MNQIRYFIAVAKELHFTRAAATCNVSQPALTKAIQKLEDEMGGQLFFRERGSTQLTELGRLILPSLERAFDAAMEARQQAETFAMRKSSPLRIGIELSIATALLRPALNAIASHCADLNLSLVQDGQADICRQMLAGDLDVAVLVEGGALNDRLHRWPLFPERYVIAFPEDHPFRGRDLVEVTELQEECLLLLQRPECPARQALLSLLKKYNVRPKREHFVSTQEQMMELILASLGICLAGEQAQLPSNVLSCSLNPDPGERQILLAVAAGRPLGPTPGLFLKLMRSRAWPRPGGLPPVPAS